MAKQKKKSAPAQDGKNANALRSWLLIALVAALFLSFYRANPGGDKVRELNQIEFYQALDEGKVVEPVERWRDYDSGETFLAGKMETDELKEDGAPVAVPYRVQLIPGENESLMEDLFARRMPVVVKERRSALSPFVVQLLVFFAFMFLFYWFFYRRAAGGGGMFGFGKSKAKLLTGKEDKAKVTFADVAGIDEAKEEVQEIVEFLKKPDMFKKLGGRIPKGILMVGPPGTGKTLLAKAIAGEAKVPFFAMSGSDFEEMFVGVGASRMRDMFSEAKKRAPCIGFIDEIDSSGMKRTGAGAIGGSHAYEQTLNTMLVEMDGFDANEGVIVIAATNRPDTLDSALLRPGRFDRQVVIDLPTLKGREEILALHGKRIKFGPDADLARVARGTPGFSGADLANLLNEAALMAAKRNLEAVDMKTLDEARDKVLWGRERKSAGYSKRDREITAWHESGHALLQLLLENTDPLHKVTIIPRGRALGATMSLPERDVLNHSRNYYLDELAVLCGGRIAEKMFTGDVSTGAAADIREATRIAREMVCTFAMSDRFGFQAFREPNGFSGMAELPPAFSEETSRAVDDEVTRLVGEAYARAEKLLAENRAKIETVAAALLERETMDGRDVEALVKGTPAAQEREEEESAE
ncbi:MAG: ATP-dependent zinc metalloprotease FtsH [Kiritimatiellae bacterium]|nr:ATP-dependent zinc metalloprotease FtsH [Kiritimatiellia bacterium]